MHRCLITFAALLLSQFIHSSLAQTAAAPRDSIPNRSADIRTDDRTILMGVDAVRRGAIKPIEMGPGKTGWIESWSSKNGSLTWTAHNSREGKYTVSTILESTGADCAVEVSIDSKRLNAPCGKKRWNKVTLGTIELAAGYRRIQFRSSGSIPLSKFF
jgi:hypothetical protein